MSTGQSRYAKLSYALRCKWDTLFPDPDQRDAWAEEFGGNTYIAQWYRDHGFTPKVAKAWVHALVDPHAALFLHSHGHAPNGLYLQYLRGKAAEVIDAPVTAPTNYQAEGHAAALAYAHPSLPIEDAVTIIRAGLTLDEAHRLITTGTLDLPALATLASLR